jgi:hypothetical protein
MRAVGAEVRLLWLVTPWERILAAGMNLLLNNAMKEKRKRGRPYFLNDMFAVKFFAFLDLEQNCSFLDGH